MKGKLIKERKYSGKDRRKEFNIFCERKKKNERMTKKERKKNFE